MATKARWHLNLSHYNHDASRQSEIVGDSARHRRETPPQQT
jgi:hypothetical protein